MHKHSKDSCINFNKTWVNDSELAFVGQIGLGPFWTLVQVLLYNNVDGVFWYTKHVHYTLVWTLL
jgi:hypothetical protein